MDLQTRKRVGVLIRLALIGLTIAIVVGWFAVKRAPSEPDRIGVQREAPTATQLGPGDLMIVSIDGNVDLILHGDQVMGGLSAQALAKIRADMAKDAGKESGLGAVIADAVKSGVSSALGTHVTYPVSEITELFFRDGQPVFKTRTSGDEEHTIGESKNSGKGKEKESARFSEADAKKFVDAFHSRKRELGIP